MENWYPEFEKSLVSQLQQAKPSDLRFFRMEEFFRNAERIGSLAATCRQCESLRLELDQLKSEVGKAVMNPGPERRRLDGLQSRINDHLRKRHGFYPPYYHSYMQSVYWTLSLMALAFVLTYLFPGLDKAVFYSPAFAVGVITGQVIGGKRDRKIRENNKTL